MAITSTQKKIIYQYLEKYINDIEYKSEGSLTINDLFDFVMKSKADQNTEIKAWAIPVLQAEKARKQGRQTDLPSEISDIDDTITEVNNL
jgi:hypothetical protein